LTTTSTTTTLIQVTQNITQNITGNISGEINASDVNVSIVVLCNLDVSQANFTVSSYSGNPTNASFSVPGLNKYYEIDVCDSLKNGLDSALLRFYYIQQEVDNAGLTESQLSMYWFNESLSVWLRLDNNTMDWVYGTGVDTIQDFVWANVTHFSQYTIGAGTQNQQTQLALGWNLLSLALTTN